MGDLIFKRISYSELQGGRLIEYSDKYGLLSKYLSPSIRNALLTNPNIIDYSKSALNLLICDGEIVGRNMLMPTAIKIKEKTVLVQSGGSYEICEQYQGKKLGTYIFKDSIFNSEYPIYIGQLYSSGASSILRKMDLCFLEKPLYFKLCKVRSVLASKGYKGLLLSLLSFFGDMWLKIGNIKNWLKYIRLKKKYSIQSEKTIPLWVDNLTLHDGHKYMEIHDHKWLQWNLDHVFSENKVDKNFFYAVYDKKKNPVGFFMTKERFEENKNGIFKNLIRGTIVEWGSIDETVLSEVDLNLLALFSFSKKVDKINTVISTNGIEDSIKQIGFSYRGMYLMTIKLCQNYDDDILNLDCWRIRYGGCNTILV